MVKSFGGGARISASADADELSKREIKMKRRMHVYKQL